MKRALSFVLTLVLVLTAVPVYAEEQGACSNVYDCALDFVSEDAVITSGSVVFANLQSAPVYGIASGAGFDWNPEAENGGANPVLTLGAISIKCDDDFAALYLPSGTTLVIPEGVTAEIENECTDGLGTGIYAFNLTVCGGGTLRIKSGSCGILSFEGLYVSGIKLEINIDSDCDNVEGIYGYDIRIDCDSLDIFVCAKDEEAAHAYGIDGESGNTFIRTVNGCNIYAKAADGAVGINSIDGFEIYGPAKIDAKSSNEPEKSINVYCVELVYDENGEIDFDREANLTVRGAVTVDKGGVFAWNPDYREVEFDDYWYNYVPGSPVMSASGVKITVEDGKLTPDEYEGITVVDMCGNATIAVGPDDFKIKAADTRDLSIEGIYATGSLDIIGDGELNVDVSAGYRGAGIVASGDEPEDSNFSSVVDMFISVYSGAAGVDGIYAWGDIYINGYSEISVEGEHLSTALTASENADITLRGDIIVKSRDGEADAVYAGNNLKFGGGCFLYIDGALGTLALDAGNDMHLHGFIDAYIKGDLYAILAFAEDGGIYSEADIYGILDAPHGAGIKFISGGEDRETSFSEDAVTEINIMGVDIPRFEDIDGFEDYYDAVLWAWSAGYMKGVSETRFMPEEAITRAEVVTVLYRLAGCPEIGEDIECPFTDVKKGSWCYDAVAWAWSNGITRGTSATTFSPKAVCSEGMAESLLARMTGGESDAWRSARNECSRADFAVMLYGSVNGDGE